MSEILTSTTEGLPSGVILASESLKDNFEDAKDYEAVQLIRCNMMMRIFVLI